jgi:uncharacterized protein YnzC (UPF0291/DUF896 family)
MSREDPYFRLRIPESLKAKVEAASVESRRSMTAEIIDRLERSFAVEAELTGMQAEAVVLEERLQSLRAEYVENIQASMRDAEELRRVMDEKFDDLDRQTREQRETFNKMIGEAEAAFGPEFMDKILNRKRED